MRGSATIISNIKARARCLDRTTAAAKALGIISGTGGSTLPLIGGSADRTRATGLLHYLHVWPEQPQELVWITPQVGIDYTIETSTDLHWTIK